jgi:hypothetical protein
MLTAAVILLALVIGAKAGLDHRHSRKTVHIDIPRLYERGCITRTEARKLAGIGPLKPGDRLP